MRSINDEITDLLAAERREREAADHAKASEARDAHVMRAERYADRAWSLAEEDNECPHIPSGVWARAA